MRAPGWLPALAASTALTALAASASAQTAITPDIGAARGLGTTVTQSGGVFMVAGGTLAGANLFHSFAQFSLAQGATAQWTQANGGAAIRNVISRVTGGQVSQISGTLDSTGLPNASFFFINPAGIVFGAGARVNAPGAAYFSTASELRFADGARFALATPNGSILSMAAPESFGFVGGQGGIDVHGAGQGFASATSTLSFSGADLRFARPSQALGDRLVVRGLDLVAVGSGAAVVSLADPMAAAAAGRVEVQRSAVVITNTDTASSGLRINGGAVALDAFNVISDAGGGQRGGDIRVRADQLSITGEGTLIGSSARATGAGGDVDLRARGIDITGGSIFSVSTTDAPGGRVRLSGDRITLTGTTVTSTNSGPGVGGDLLLAGALTMRLDGASVISSTLGAGRGGSIAVSGPSMQLFAANLLSSSLAAALPGNVNIDGGVIEISGGSYGTSPGLRSDSGALVLNAATSLSVAGATFTAASSSERGAGSITIRSPRVFMTETRVRADNFGDGGAGTILIEAGNLIVDKSTIGVEANGEPGDRVGLIRLRSTGDLIVINSDITSNTNKRASAGIVEIAGKDVQLLEARVRSDTIGLATGNAGSVSIKADTLKVSNGSVTSNSRTPGDAGDVVVVVAGAMTLDTSASIRSNTSDSGNAGLVSITAGSLSVQENSSITSRADSGTGNAGTVRVVADSLTMVDGRISSGTDGDGRGGTVSIKVGQLLLDGERRGFNTFITSETTGDGDAGGVVIDAKSLTVRNLAFISSDSIIRRGNAGTIDIVADTITLDGGGFISSDTFTEGNAGDVTIRAGRLTILGNESEASYISSDAILGGGNAGRVSIDAKTLLLDQGGFVSSETTSGGNAGDIAIKSDAITLQNFGNVRSRTLSAGRAGSITIGTGSLTLMNTGIISSAATEDSSGAAGVVDIFADNVVVGNGSLISTSSRGSGDAGEVGIVAKSLIVDGGLITSAAELGGTGAANTLRVTATSLTVRNGGMISTVSFNPRRAGTVDITAGTLLVDGARSLVTSANQAGNLALGAPPGPGGDAGSVLIRADGMTVSNGGRITTDSFGGAAGDIRISIKRPGLLVLEGTNAPGSIQTSSGRATGGQITIVDPLAIVSNGGSILALGQQRGANVLIQSRYFINSTDRTNVLAVDGEVRLETGLYDVSSGVVSRDLSVLDASKVLRGQCPAARSAGAVSQLITRPVGPYVREAAADDPVQASTPVAATPGDCR